MNTQPDEQSKDGQTTKDILSNPVVQSALQRARGVEPKLMDDSAPQEKTDYKSILNNPTVKSALSSAKYGSVSEYKPTMMEKVERTFPRLLSTEKNEITGRPRGLVPAALEISGESPLEAVPEAQIKPEDSVPMAAGKEAYNMALGFGRFLTSPMGIATVESGGIIGGGVREIAGGGLKSTATAARSGEIGASFAAGAGRLISGAFTADMGIDLGKSIHDVFGTDQWSRMSNGQKLAFVEGAAGNALLTAIVGKHAIKKSPVQFSVDPEIRKAQIAKEILKLENHPKFKTDIQKQEKHEMLQRDLKEADYRPYSVESVEDESGNPHHVVVDPDTKQVGNKYDTANDAKDAADQLNFLVGRERVRNQPLLKDGAQFIEQHKAEAGELQIVTDDVHEKETGKFNDFGIAYADRASKKIVINREAFNLWLHSISPERRSDAVKSLLAEERIHHEVTDEQAKQFWNSLSSAERFAMRWSYAGGKYKFKPLTYEAKDLEGATPETAAEIQSREALAWGHEAVRYHLQKLRGGTPTEIAQEYGGSGAFRRRMSIKAVNSLASIVSHLKSRFGSGMTAEALVRRIADNFELAKSAHAGEPKTAEPAAAEPAESADPFAAGRGAKLIEWRREMLTHAAYINPKNKAASIGANHIEAAAKQGIKAPEDRSARETADYGFRTTRGRYVTRDAGLLIAQRNGQLKVPLAAGEKLHSENVNFHPSDKEPIDMFGYLKAADWISKIHAAANEVKDRKGVTFGELGAAEQMLDDLSSMQTPPPEQTELFAAGRGRPKKDRLDLWSKTQPAMFSPLDLAAGGEVRERDVQLPRPKLADAEARSDAWFEKAIGDSVQLAKKGETLSPQEMLSSYQKSMSGIFTSLRMTDENRAELYQKNLVSSLFPLSGDDLQAVMKATFGPESRLSSWKIPDPETTEPVRRKDAQLALDSIMREVRADNSGDPNAPIDIPEGKIQERMGHRYEDPQNTKLTGKEYDAMMAERRQVVSDLRLETPVEERRRAIRAKAVSMITKRWLRPMMETKADLDRKEIKPEEIFVDRRANVPSYQQFSPDEAYEPDFGLLISNGHRRSSKEPTGVTRRISVVVGEDGRTHMVSTWRNPTGEVFITNPDNPTGDGLNIRDALKKYKFKENFLILDPTKNFKKSYDTFRDYVDDFGRYASRNFERDSEYDPNTIPLEDFMRTTMPGEFEGSDLPITEGIETGQMGMAMGPFKGELQMESLPERSQKEKSMRIPIQRTEAEALGDFLADTVTVSDVRKKLTSLQNPERARKSYAKISQALDRVADDLVRMKARRMGITGLSGEELAKVVEQTERITETKPSDKEVAQESKLIELQKKLKSAEGDLKYNAAARSAIIKIAKQIARKFPTMESQAQLNQLVYRLHDASRRAVFKDWMTSDVMQMAGHRPKTEIQTQQAPSGKELTMLNRRSPVDVRPENLPPATRSVWEKMVKTEPPAVDKIYPPAPSEPQPVTDLSYLTREQRDRLASYPLAPWEGWQLDIERWKEEFEAGEMRQPEVEKKTQADIAEAEKQSEAQRQEVLWKLSELKTYKPEGEPMDVSAYFDEQRKLQAEARAKLNLFAGGRGEVIRDHDLGEPLNLSFDTKALQMLHGPAKFGMSEKEIVDGAKTVTALRKSLKPAEWDMLKRAGIESEFNGRQVPRSEMVGWVSRNQPFVTIERHLAAPKLTPYEATESQKNELMHDVETKFRKTFGEIFGSKYGLRRPAEVEHYTHEIRKDAAATMSESDLEYAKGIESKLNEIESKLSKFSQKEIEAYVPSISATARFNEVNPKPVKEMEEPTDLLVRLPFEAHKFKSDHYPKSHGAGLLSHARVYVERGPNGEKILHVFEVQSDWSKARDWYIEDEKKQRAEGNDAAADYAKSKHEESPKILDDYNRITLKAAIKHALDTGCTHIAISDAETAMLTQRHDQSYEFVSGVYEYPRNPKYNVVIPKSGDSLDVPYLKSKEPKGKLSGGGDVYDIIQLNKEAEKYIGEYIPKHIPQEKGMRQNYGKSLPRIASKLTGYEPKRVSFGEHKNAYGGVSHSIGPFASYPRAAEVASQNGIPLSAIIKTEEGYDFGRWAREDLRFPSGVGKMKTDITANVFPLDKVNAASQLLFAAGRGPSESVAEFSAHLMSLTGAWARRGPIESYISAGADAYLNTARTTARTYAKELRTKATEGGKLNKMLLRGAMAMHQARVFRKNFAWSPEAVAAYQEAADKMPDMKLSQAMIMSMSHSTTGIEVDYHALKMFMHSNMDAPEFAPIKPYMIKLMAEINKGAADEKFIEAEAHRLRTDGDRRIENSLVEKGLLKHDTATYRFDESSRPKLESFKKMVDAAIAETQRKISSLPLTMRGVARASLKDLLEHKQDIEFALANWRNESLRDVTLDATKKLNEQFDREVEDGATLSYNEGYLPGRYDGQFYNNDSIVFGPQIIGRNYAQAKTFSNYYEAASQGYIAATHDISDLVEHRLRQGMIKIGRNAWESMLTNIKDPWSGMPAFAAASPTERGYVADLPKGIDRNAYEAVHSDGSRKPVYALKGSYAKLLSALVSPSASQKSTVGSAVLKADIRAKHFTVLGDVYHMGMMKWLSTSVSGVKNLAFGSHVPGWAALEFRESGIKEAVKNGVLSQKTADWLMEKIPYRSGAESMTITRLDAARKLQEAGFNSGRLGDAIYDNLFQPTTALGKIGDKYNKFLFDKYSRGLMMKSALSEYERLSAKDPQKSSETIMRSVAKDLNSHYGAVGKQGLIKNQTYQDLLSIFFFAPRWFGGVVRRDMAIPYKMLTSPVETLKGEESAARAVAQGMVGMFVLTQGINLISRGQPTWKNKEEEHRWDAYIGDGVFISPLSVFNELIGDYVRYGETMPEPWKRLEQIGINKLSVFGKAAIILGSKQPPKDLLTLFPAPITFKAMGQKLASSATGGMISPPDKATLRRSEASLLGLRAESQPDISTLMSIKAQKFVAQNNLKPDMYAGAKPVDDANYSALRRQVKLGNARGALATLEAMKAKGVSDEQVMRAMWMWKNRPFTGSKRNEYLWLSSMSADELSDYRDAVLEKNEVFEKWVNIYLGASD